jgi:hypothetical protein
MTSEPDVSSRYTLSDEGEFLRLRWTAGVTMDADDVRSRISAIKAMSTQGKRPLLVHIGLVDRIIPEAKQLLIEDISPSRVALLSNDQVGRVIIAFCHRNAVPSRRFTDEHEAIVWLTDDLVFAANPKDR